MSIVLWPGDTVDVKLHNTTQYGLTAEVHYEGEPLVRNRIAIKAIHVHLRPQSPLESRPDGGSVDALELSVRTANCLERASVKTIGQLARMTKDQLMAIRGFSLHCVEDVRKELQRLGLDISGARTLRSKKGTKR